jgi:hypothetical protein
MAKIYRSQSDGSPTRLSQGLFLSELSALEYIFVQHAAAVALTSDKSPFRNMLSIEELMDVIDIGEDTWTKIFKPKAKKGAKEGELQSALI